MHRGLDGMEGTVKNDSGILYVLTNPQMRGIVKIGFTTGSLDVRMRNLSSPPGVPVRFKCHFAAEVPSIQETVRC